jgi:ACT domain-containing protein
MKAVITVVGSDKVGIISNVSRILAERDVNILDISQTIMQNMFTMIMLVDVERAQVDVKELSSEMNQLGQEMELTIHVQNEAVFESMHRI